MRRKRHTRRKEIIEIPKTRSNAEITSKEVRLLNLEGVQQGVIPTVEALKLAENENLDLVEISNGGDFPVCKIMDYSKYVFDTKKKQIQVKKSQKQIEQKTIKFRPNTNQGDYDIKKRKILEFLEKGHRVKIIIWFRGREMVHQAIGQEMLKKIKVDLVDLVRIDDEPKLEGRQMIMGVSPLSNKKK